METEVAFAIAFATGVLAYIAGKRRGHELERQRWHEREDDWPE